MASGARDEELTGISVAYSNQLSAPSVKMSKRARKVARRKLKNDGEPISRIQPSSRRRLRPSDPTQNNPNDIGAVIVPPGQGIM